MNVKHTKGPWAVSSSTLIVNSEAQIVANTIPVVVPGLDIPIKEAIANARLIAAAPELLQACREALIIVEDESYTDEIEMLKTAIKKAEL